MRKLLIVPALLLALGVGGCSSIDKLRDVASSVTSTVTNPVSKYELARVEATYEAALAAFVSYRRYCYSKPLTQLPQSVCGKRRTIIRAMQSADRKAFAAISAARNFVAQNPTISAVSFIAAARQAVTDFKAITDQTQL